MNNDFYDYYFLNGYKGSRSVTGTVEQSLTMRYFMRSLFQRAMSVISFSFKNTAWDKRYFKNVLLRDGFIPIIKTEKYGVIPQRGTLTGRGLFENPTTAMVVNHLVNYRGEIGRDCEIVTLTPDYFGIFDLVEHYALQLSEEYTTLKTSMRNSRVAFLLAAKDKTGSETLKVISERISAGEPLIVYDKKLREDIGEGEPLFEQAYNVRDAYIVTEALQDMQSIISAFDKEVGIPSVQGKKERYIQSEVDVLTADSVARLTVWRECLGESIDRVNAFYGDELIRFKTILDMERGSTDGHIKTDADRRLQL